MRCEYCPISRQHGNVMPSSCLVNRCYGIHVYHGMYDHGGCSIRQQSRLHLRVAHNQVRTDYHWARPHSAEFVLCSVTFWWQSCACNCSMFCTCTHSGSPLAFVLLYSYQQPVFLYCHMGCSWQVCYLEWPVTKHLWPLTSELLSLPHCHLHDWNPSIRDELVNES